MSCLSLLPAQSEKSLSSQQRARTVVEGETLEVGNQQAIMCTNMQPCVHMFQQTSSWSGLSRCAVQFALSKTYVAFHLYWLIFFLCWFVIQMNVILFFFSTQPTNGGPRRVLFGTQPDVLFLTLQDEMRATASSPPDTEEEQEEGLSYTLRQQDRRRDHQVLR